MTAGCLMKSPFRPFRLMAALAAVAMLAACAGKGDLDKPPPNLGPFKLGLNIVVAKGARQGPVSRSATPEEWENAIKTAVQDRFGRYHGDKFYDIGIHVDGYALAPPGIPIVLSPKSVLAMTVNIWDDSARKILNAKPKRIIVFEGMNAETIFGSGLLQDKKKQMQILSYNAAKAIQDWLVKHPEWFPGAPAVPDGGTGTAEAPDSAAAASARAAAQAAVQAAAGAKHAADGAN